MRGKEPSSFLEPGGGDDDSCDDNDDNYEEWQPTTEVRKELESIGRVLDVLHYSQMMMVMMLEASRLESL